MTKASVVTQGFGRLARVTTKEINAFDQVVTELAFSSSFNLTPGLCANATKRRSFRNFYPLSAGRFYPLNKKK
jgi:hypothetical protein